MPEPIDEVKLREVCPPAATLYQCAHDGLFGAVSVDTEVEAVCARLLELEEENRVAWEQARSEEAIAIRAMKQRDAARGSATRLSLKLGVAEDERDEAQEDADDCRAAARTEERIRKEAESERDAALARVKELEADVERLRGGPSPGPVDGCSDCGRALVWTGEGGSLVCPRCVWRRMERAEAEVERLKAATLAYLCAECGAPSYAPIDSIDSGTTLTCGACAGTTIVGLHTAEEYCASANRQARIERLTRELNEAQHQADLWRNAAPGDLRRDIERLKAEVGRLHTVMRDVADDLVHACNCGEEYTSRRMTAPDCIGCWVADGVTRLRAELEGKSDA